MRHIVALLAGAILTTSIGCPATAVADEPGPLYDLVDAAARRLQTADPVAAFKWVNGGPIEDPVRVRQVLDAVGVDAADRGIDVPTVQAAFADQIRATEGVEYARFGQWKLDPAAAPTDAPDLSASRATIDALNRTIVDEMAQHWDVLRGNGCERDRADAQRAAVADLDFDPLYQQALAFATRSYCAP